MAAQPSGRPAPYNQTVTESVDKTETKKLNGMAFDNVGVN